MQDSKQAFKRNDTYLLVFKTDFVHLLIGQLGKNHLDFIIAVTSGVIGSSFWLIMCKIFVLMLQNNINKEEGLVMLSLAMKWYNINFQCIQNREFLQLK